MKARLSDYRQSPRKVRLVTELVKGKDVEQALAELRFTAKRASAQIEKLIRSAVSNSGKENGEGLYVKEIRVDEGPTLKRFRPRARGRASRIHKRTSHVTVELEERQ